MDLLAVLFLTLETFDHKLANYMLEHIVFWEGVDAKVERGEERSVALSNGLRLSTRKRMNLLFVGQTSMCLFDRESG